MADQFEQLTSEQIAIRDQRPTRMERQQSRGFLQNIIQLIPNLLKLLYRLMKDNRVPTTEKVFLVGAIAYVISPIDLIPDVIPFIGQVDDLYVVALTLLRLFTRTPANVVREHWDGGGDIAHITGRIAQAATHLLPKRISQILLGKIIIAPKIKGGIFTSPEADESHYKS